MTDKSNFDKEKEFARKIVLSTTREQQISLLEWAIKLKEIRDSDISPFTKAKRSLQVTLDRKVLKPVMKMIYLQAKEMFASSKEVLWGNRSWPFRIGSLGLLIATLGFSGKAAGLAAFGRGISVPLWLVFTASGTVLGTLIQELESCLGYSKPRTTYYEIEADKIEPPSDPK